jgi:hypothetical protein
MIEEITNVVTAIAKNKGCNLLLDKSGPAANLDSYPFLAASDSGLDLTGEVMARINQDRPANSAAP